MKNLLKHIRTISFTILIVMLLSSMSYVSAQVNIIGEQEAVELAIHYYCLNSLDKDVVIFDDYVVTPLYNEAGDVTYYCVDFFYQDESKGYVVISGNLTSFQCPEISLQETSIYYLDMQEGKETIYYNPFEVFTIDEDKYFDINGQEVLEKEVEGHIADGNLIENRTIMATSSNIVDPLEDPRVFSQNPVHYLQSLGYTNLSCTAAGTIETAMNNAGAFNPMYASSSLPKTLPGGTVLRNAGHCCITALSNIMMYWESIYSTRYPDTYAETFEKVLKVAVENNYFNNVANGGGITHSNAISIFNKINQIYNYSGRSFSNYENSIDFIRQYIDADWPILLSFHTNNSAFPYTSHATVAFGYCEITGYIGNYLNQYMFVKFYDGYTSTGRGKVYVCWDMIEYSEYYLSSPINTNMTAFCPY